MIPELKVFLIKFAGVLILSPIVGYMVVQIVQWVEKAKKHKGKERWISLFLIGFYVAVLLGWLL